MIINFEFNHENSLSTYFVEKIVGNPKSYKTLNLFIKTRVQWVYEHVFNKLTDSMKISDIIKSDKVFLQEVRKKHSLSFQYAHTHTHTADNVEGD